MDICFCFSSANSQLQSLIILYNYLRNWQAIFQSSCAIYTPPAVYEGSSFSTSLPVLLFYSLFYYSHFTGCEVVPRCDFNWGFCNDTEDPFMYLSAIFVSLMKCLFRYVAHCKLRLFDFLLLSCKNSLYILDKL